MMRDWMKKGLAASLGFAVISKERMEKTLREMVKRGEMTPSASKELLEKLVARGEQEQEQLDEYLQGRIKKLLSEMSMATKEDTEALQQEIQLLESRLARLETQSRPPVQADHNSQGPDQT